VDGVGRGVFADVSFQAPPRIDIGIDSIPGTPGTDDRLGQNWRQADVEFSTRGFIHGVIQADEVFTGAVKQ
jgi:hypothetical protein